MSSIKLSPNASGTGIFTVAAPNSNTDRTLTLPDNSGTLLSTATPGVPVNGPAFRATRTSSVAISAGTRTKLATNSTTFDTNSSYDGATNYRFTPTVAGYYQVNGLIVSTGTSVTALTTEIRKNGTAIAFAYMFTNSTSGGAIAVTDLVYMNGSTDYIELWGQINASSGTTFDGGSNFSAYLARAA